jgi:hypothetical protein
MLIGFGEGTWDGQAPKLDVCRNVEGRIIDNAKVAQRPMQLVPAGF